MSCRSCVTDHVLSSVQLAGTITGTGVVLIGVVVAGVVLAGVVLAGVVLAGVVLAGVVLSAVDCAGIVPCGSAPATHLPLSVHKYPLLHTHLVLPGCDVDIGGHTRQ